MQAAPTVPEMFLQFSREQHPVHDGNHRAQMADHRQITLPRPAAMDIAVAPAHRAERGTQIRPHGVNDRFAEREPSGGVADERREHVAFFQGQTDGNAQGLLAAAEKNAAVDFPGAVKRGELVVQHARQQHDSGRRQGRFRGTWPAVPPCGVLAPFGAWRNFTGETARQQCFFQIQILLINGCQLPAKGVKPKLSVRNSQTNGKF